jgi:hypothetical protein
VPKLAPFYPAIGAYVAERGDTTIEELRTWLLRVGDASGGSERRADLAHIEAA